MRDPSIHIVKSDFLKVLNKIGLSPEYADRIFEAAIPYHIKSRYLIKANAKDRQKLERVVESSNIAEFSVEKFNGLLHGLRMNRGDKFIQKINKGTNEWAMLKEILVLAHSFTEVFKFGSADEGYKVFLLTGMELMGRKYSLNRYKYYAAKIHDRYEAKMVMDEDPNTEASRKFWSCWKKAMEDNGSVIYDVLQPDRFMHIIYGRQEADEIQAKYEDWIDAQFEGLAFLNAVPELSQLYGPNAKLRYEKYRAAQAGNKKKTNKEEIKEDTEVIARMPEDQREYFAELRRKKAGN